METGYAPEDVAGFYALIEYRRKNYGLDDVLLQALVRAVGHHHEIHSRPAMEVVMEKNAVEAFVAAVSCAIKASKKAKLLDDHEMASALRGMADALDASPRTTMIGDEIMIDEEE